MIPLVKEDVMKYLGINGLGRIGKLTLWNQICIGHFDGYVINAGREIGRDLGDFIHFITTDSTYGELSKFLYGHKGKECDIEIVNMDNWEFKIDGTYFKVLTKDRNPKDIKWKDNGVDVVVDCTGVFLNPSDPLDAPKGSVRGHLEAGAKKVICSAPFKLGKEGMPEDSKMVVYGVNHNEYDSKKHDIISGASCTTTGLSHMMKPLLRSDRVGEVLSVSMSTIHAATNNQEVLDALPKSGAKDLRRNRSVFNNIIITSTGAAKALKIVLPELKEVPFVADSIRVPTNTVSLISLNVAFDGDISAEEINEVYKNFAEKDEDKMLVYSEIQNVSSDLRGKRASIIIEGVETASEVIDVKCGMVTHAKIMGWYDNEFGNYVNSLCKIINYVETTL